jgi:hypothetical protein
VQPPEIPDLTISSFEARTRQRREAMRLTEREIDKLMIFTAREPVSEKASGSSEEITVVTGRTLDGLYYLRALARDGLTPAKELRTFVNAWRETQGMTRLAFERFSS